MQLLRSIFIILLYSLPLSLAATESGLSSQPPVTTEKTTSSAKPAQEETDSPFAKGKKLHEEQCVTCHTAKNPENPTGLYTREDRKVTSQEGLKNQIQRCVTQLELLWFEEDIAHVATYSQYQILPF